ncbi:MAG: HAMP domain-containing histidine kinase [Spirochaetes bacterium]|nr:HAMP domain-containing histidine kinase [Spirochaetota bacterium]
MATFHLESDTISHQENKKKITAYSSQLSDFLLNKNIYWFIKLRFIVIIALTIAGFFAYFFPKLLYGLGLTSWNYWFFIIAFVLFLANCGYWLISVKKYVVSPSAIIWLQIFIDLLTLTAVIHFTGSIGSPAAFLYVIHIALSCIFFKSRSSLMVTLLASAFYIGCLLLEFTGLLPPVTIIHYTPKTYLYYKYTVYWVFAIIIIFFIIWFIVSRLSSIIRMREIQLLSIEDDLKETQRMKDHYAIQMTHQLKSPLDALRSSIMLIMEGYYGNIDGELKTVMERIDLRAKAMGDLILDVLRLARLLDPNKNKQSFEKIELSEMLNKLIDYFKTSAGNRGISFITDIIPVEINGVPDQIQILLSNLISNAVNYSYDNGIVTIKLYKGNENNPVILIADNGIGIPEDKLPNIFNEYFKTKEAMKHNITSTGIGLSMVKRVAEVYHIRISVTSKLGKGTSFRLYFPPL